MGAKDGELLLHLRLARLLYNNELDIVEAVLFKYVIIIVLGAFYVIASEVYLTLVMVRRSFSVRAACVCK